MAVAYLSTRMELLAQPLGISIADANQFKQYVAVSFFLLLIFAAFGLLACYKGGAGLYFIYFTLFSLLVFNANFGILDVVFSAKSARKLAHQIPAFPPRTELAFLQCFPSGLPFYLNRTATLITKDGGELASNYILFHLKAEQIWPSNLVSVAEFDHWLTNRNHPVYLLARESDRPKLAAIAAGQNLAIQQLTSPYIGVLLPAQ
jgi:hypothetical protein